MNREVVLDTHALVWWVADPRRLSAPAHAQIAAADEVVISAASAWELALLVEAERIALDRPVRTWLQHVSRLRSVRHVPIDLEIAVAAVELAGRGFPRDPADQFIYATAASRRAELVSKDAAIRSFAEDDPTVAVSW